MSQIDTIFQKFVVIPAYRPDQAFPLLTKDICDMGYRLVVVNDGSEPTFDHIFAQIDPRATLLAHKRNKGKGAALKTAYAYILDSLQDTTRALICTADGYGQHLPHDMEKVLDAAEAIEKHKREGDVPVIVLGARLLDRRMPFRSRLGNSLTKELFHIITGTKLSDTQTGLRAFSATLLPFMLSVEGERYEYEMNVLTKMARKGKGQSFFEVPITTIHHSIDKSITHFHPIKDSFRIYAHLFKFAGSSFVSFLLDFVAFCVFSYVFSQLMTSWGDLVANVVARIMSATLNYNLNCRLVFEKKPSKKTALSFALLSMSILILNSVVLYLWKQTPLPVWFCKLLTEFCMFFVNYLFQHKVVFKKKNKYKKHTKAD